MPSIRVGFLRPSKISALMHSAGSLTHVSFRSIFTSASQTAYFGRIFNPLFGNLA